MPIRLLLLIASWLLISTTQAQETATETITLRAIWNPSTLALINISDAPANASNLRFAALLGEITPFDWTMNTDPITNQPYSLARIHPGDCLVAYFGIDRPQIPETVTCNRVVGQFIVTTTDDLVWSVPQGGFTAYLGAQETQACDIRTSSCDLPAQPAGEAPLTPAEPATVNISAIWNAEVFVLLNTSGRAVDISDLRLTSPEGEIRPEQWALDFSPQPYSLADFRPGSCLVAHLGAEQPPLPAEIQCARIIGRFVALTTNDLIWSVPQGGFTTQQGEALAHECSIQRSSCAIPVPNPNAPPALSTLQVLWTPQALIVRNNSPAAVDVSGLWLVGGGAEITASFWQMQADSSGVSYDLSAMPPGSCLVAYQQGAEELAFPALECAARIGEYAISPDANLVWGTGGDTFTAYWQQAVIAACITAQQACEIVLP